MIVREGGVIKNTESRSKSALFFVDCHNNSLEMELNNKNGILWKTVRKKERFSSFFKKSDGNFKKN